MGLGSLLKGEVESRTFGFKASDWSANLWRSGQKLPFQFSIPRRVFRDGGCLPKWIYSILSSLRNMYLKHLQWSFIDYAAAAAAKSLQSCLTLWDPIDCSPPGSSVPRILQARPLEWVAISFSSAWKEKWKGSHSVMSDSQWSHGLQPTRLLCPWDFPGKSTGVGCHCLLHIDYELLILHIMIYSISLNHCSILF